MKVWDDRGKIIELVHPQSNNGDDARCPIIDGLYLVIYLIYLHPRKNTKEYLMNAHLRYVVFVEHIFSK